jgi:MFS transporter, ACDE family, multidrug resistance protein
MNSNNPNSSSLFQDKNFYIINAVTLVAIMGGITIAPVLPTLATTFRAAPNQIELVMSVFLVPAAIATPIFGLLVDRLGRKQILVPSLLLFAIAGSFAAFAQDFNTLLACRFVQGIGGGSLELVALTLFGDLYRGRMMVAVMSFNAAMIGISTTLYPLIGGILAAFNWRYPFLLSVVGFPIAFLVLIVLKLPRMPKNPQPLSLQSYAKKTLASVNNQAVFGLFLAIAASFILDFGAIVTYVPILVGVTFNSAAWIAGIILASKAISMSLIASRLEALTNRFSAIALIKLSFVVSAIAFAIIPSVHNVWLLILPMLLSGIAQCLVLPSSQALIAGLATQEARGGVMAINATVQAVGQALGPILAGTAFSLWGMQGVFFASAGFALAVSTVFNYLVSPKQPIAFPRAQSMIHAEETVPDQPMVKAITTIPSAPSYTVAPKPVATHTILQVQKAQLLHTGTNRAIALPSYLSIIHLGKPNDRIPPDIDLSELPNAQVVSRIHADIRVEGDDYFLQDAGSANGTILNNYPLLPGNWYKLRSGDRISFGKGQLVQFLFQLSE